MLIKKRKPPTALILRQYGRTPEAFQVHNGREEITHGREALCLLLHQDFVCPAAALTSSIVSLIAFGFPGKFIMSVLPLNPAVWRESTAVGTCLRIA